VPLPVPAYLSEHMKIERLVAALEGLHYARPERSGASLGECIVRVS
jgi:hypothetical protein